MTDVFLKNVKFSGNQSVRDEMIDLVDSVMKTHGEVEGLGDLSAGLSDLSQRNRVTVTDEDDCLAVVATATETDDETGRFVVDKQTRTIYQVGVKPSDEVAIDEDMDFLDDI